MVIDGTPQAPDPAIRAEEAEVTIGVLGTVPCFSIVVFVVSTVQVRDIGSALGHRSPLNPLRKGDTPCQVGLLFPSRPCPYVSS